MEIGNDHNIGDDFVDVSTEVIRIEIVSCVQPDMTVNLFAIDCARCTDKDWHMLHKATPFRSHTYFGRENRSYHHHYQRRTFDE